MINDDNVKFSSFSNSEQINEHKSKMSEASVTEKKKVTGGVLRDILVIEDEGMFNVAFLRINGCHSDNLNSRAEVPTGWNVFIYLHRTTHLGERPHPVFRR